jgi:N-dimethylarginine dimethylaminohydrolase
MQSCAQPILLMCRPHYFGVSYIINPWMDPQAWASQGFATSRAAELQWTALYSALVNAGAAIECIEPQLGLPDLVFTANAAIVLDGKALLSRFQHPERQREEPVFAAAFRRLQANGQISTVTELPRNIVLEGAGDCIWDAHRGQFWMGYGPRSQSTAAILVADYFGVDCITLELGDPTFYHLDTAFHVLPAGEVMYYPAALTPRARCCIEERVAPEKRITLEPTDALKFAANAVSFRHFVILSSCTNALRADLHERGFAVIETPLNAFQFSGGSACCLTLRLDYVQLQSTAHALLKRSTAVGELPK